MVGEIGTSTVEESGESTGNGRAAAAQVEEDGTADKEWEGFGDEGSDRDKHGQTRAGDKASKLKPAKQKKGIKEKKQKPPTTGKATSTAENSFAKLEDAADDEINGRSYGILLKGYGLTNFQSPPGSLSTCRPRLCYASRSWDFLNLQLFKLPPYLRFSMDMT